MGADQYGLVSFQLSQLNLTEQHQWLVGLVDKLFGVSEEGEYIVAVELIDTAVPGDERIVARKVIAHFVKKDKGFLVQVLGFKGNAQELTYINYADELIHRLPINGNTNSYSIALEVYKSKSTQLTDGSLIGTVIDLINTTSGALKFTPINDGVKTVYDAMRKIGFDLYKTLANDGSKVVIVQTQMSFIVANQCESSDSESACKAKTRPNLVRFVFPYDFSQPIRETSNRVELWVRFETRESEIGNFRDGKFQAPFNWINWLKQGQVAGKGVIQFLLDRDSTKSFVAALEKGKTEVQKYAASTNDNSIASACGIIVSELAGYFSTPDVGALYWAFLQNYLDKFDGVVGGTTCLHKYSAIYFEPYGLPKVDPSSFVSPLMADIPLSITGPDAPTAAELVRRLQGLKIE
jgi:hypothetical protein